ncbi:MAG TPA: hypothetical protein DEG17_03745 [Cyanobacteria bacterium UBA11149]|nr:hypothetical protein [Cyanobacteria bacterium UBA11367]HBE58244.1 hypothetical protein [Cyanobacteria bacterium UBA11366]HBK66963.1 hypothetical protein [Cyanobacteria bacterium UBA11166]HBR75031.1 hypothetical protein [Cyanobacteria bacterium UBA11159]HBS70770.1 hypothetical protein [Cyanobacteria bacterium UBA11153]HBW88017.1 hypothetical protein [Cyanobacteria bacterium UBA11149]HCA98075.1 hypothetical protein [Cyanobacteria bacterium UBA9226]
MGASGFCTHSKPHPSPPLIKGREQEKNDFPPFALKINHHQLPILQIDASEGQLVEVSKW